MRAPCQRTASGARGKQSARTRQSPPQAKSRTTARSAGACAPRRLRPAQKPLHVTPKHSHRWQWRQVEKLETLHRKQDFTGCRRERRIEIEGDGCACGENHSKAGEHSVREVRADDRNRVGLESALGGACGNGGAEELAAANAGFPDREHFRAEGSGKAARRSQARDENEARGTNGEACADGEARTDSEACAADEAGPEARVEACAQGKASGTAQGE